MNLKRHKLALHIFYFAFCIIFCICCWNASLHVYLFYHAQETLDFILFCINTIFALFMFHSAANKAKEIAFVNAFSDLIEESESKINGK